MVDQYTREQLYDYQTNANLVVNLETYAPRENAPSGEPDSLAGRPLHKFGDRARKEKPAKEPQKGQARTSKRVASQGYSHEAKKSRLVSDTNMNVLDLELAEQLVYKPKTKETQLIYEELLTIMHHHLPDQPPSILKGSLDVILATIKLEDKKDSDKLQDIEAVIGKISNEEFNKIYQLCKGLVDYEESEQRDEFAGENAIEVPVEFEKDEAEDEQSEHEKDGEDDDIHDEVMDEDFDDKKFKDEQIQAQFAKKDYKNSNLTHTEKNQLNVEDVFNSPYWLQNYLREKLKVDDSMMLLKEKEILGILRIKDKRECENKLVQNLKYENFPFIKFLIENRLLVHYLTKLGKCENEDEKKEIIKEMCETPEGSAVYSQIEAYQMTKDAQEKSEMEQEEDFIKEPIDKKITESQISNIVRTHLDLDSLKFSSGAHFMSQKQIVLPKGSFRTTHAGYEEVYIPPPSSSESHKDIKEISVQTLPEWMHAAFKQKDRDGNYAFITEKFNKVQSKVLPTALETDENMLVCAPTSSGKTNIALLAILRLIANHRNDLTGTIKTKSFKIIYIAPMKALVKETVGNFSQRLKEFNLTVRELSGDINMTKNEIQQTNVIVTTPEKWDIITRKVGEKAFTDLVKLIIVDEIHLLHDTRGAVLEAIIARTVRKMESSNEKLRIIALSATLPNYEDVATFLRVDQKNGLFYFDASFRPIPLEQRFIGITEKKGVKKMLLVNEITYEKVSERVGKKQIIIFVHSRRETLRTARSIKEMAINKDELGKFLLSEGKAMEFRAILSEDSSSGNIKDKGLSELLEYGIGIHHAGMERSDREIVEEYFNNGYLNIVVSTATLAWGVNLPAHTVIIKGTQVYDPEAGSWMELSHLDIMQMMGRAGRWGYGSPIGEGIIITSHYELQYYLSLLNQQLPIESQMISALPDALNAEIVSGTVSNLKDAMNWMAYTYLYVRMLQSPRLYGISTEEEFKKDRLLVKRRADLIHTAANILDKHGLIKYDKRTGYFSHTQIGRVASFYYIKHPSMAVYNEYLKPTINIIDLFRLFSLSHEFKLIPIREEEKKEIEKLMLKVPIPIKGSMEEPASKINILLQAYISQFKLEGYAISSDMVYISQSAGRIFRALFEICVKRCWASLALITLNVCKMVEKRMWSTMSPLRQFNIIPEDILHKIESKEQLTWDRFYDLTSTQISELIKVNKKNGEGIHKLVHTFPRLELSANIQPLTRNCILVDLVITPDFKWNSIYHGSTETFHIFVEDNDSEIILHYELFLLKEKYPQDEEHRLTFIVPMIEPVPPQYFIRVVSDKWINCEKLLAISFKHTILPEKFPPHTGLLDLQPLPFSVLKYPKAEAMYTDMDFICRYSIMNAIQTQTFKNVYETNESVLVGATTGSGKTLIAEFAMLKYLQENNSLNRKYVAPIVYICPIEANMNEKMREFTLKFEEYLGFKVKCLTGQMTVDNSLFDDCHLLLSTPEKLDMLTRRWRKKQTIQEISLVIIDEIHLIGESGSVLEAVISRLRYMSSQLEKEIRFIAVGSSIANPQTLCEWLGVQSKNCFNFNPNVRPNKIEIFFHGFDHYQRKMRLYAMNKPIYLGLKQHCYIKGFKLSCMIYVADRTQTRMLALDLLTNFANDDDMKRCLISEIPEREFEDLLNEIYEPTLKHCLRYGIGYIHDALIDREKEIVIQLYLDRIIQVLILTHSVCWEINLFSHVVIIADPMKYDGKDHTWVDYSIPDMYQIMGRASIIYNIDSQRIPTAIANSVRKCLIFFQNTKKEFYKKFLLESFPVESHLNHFLHDHLIAEIVSGTIQTKQECIDWLTWTFIYRRLLQNPNYYDMKGKSNVFLNDYLSELVEHTLMDLAQSKCISIIENSGEIKPLNLGKIAMFYYVKYSTIDLFSQSLTENSNKLGEMLMVLKSAYEFEDITCRKGEDGILCDMAKEIPYTYLSEDMKKALTGDLEEVFSDPHNKAFVLLQSYFGRKPVPSDMLKDMKEIVSISSRLVLSMVDVLSSKQVLKPALLAMELSQMIVQSMWITQNPLYQLPYFDDEVVNRCISKKVEDIADLMNMEDEDRANLLQMTPSQLTEIARVCNRYPLIEMKITQLNQDLTSLKPGDAISLNVELVRDYDEQTLSVVNSLYFPIQKEEAWWIVIGDPKSNFLTLIKRLTFVKDFKITLTFEAPKVAGSYAYKVYLFCDSWIGCDQDESLSLTVVEQ